MAEVDAKQGTAGADGADPIAWKDALPTNDDEGGKLLRIRHSTAHVMAMAVQKLFNGTKVSIGPWIENGFYYDFDPPEPFQEKDLRRIKKQMDKIIQQKLPFTEEEVTREEAKRRILAQDEPYKLEILNRIKSDRITIWHTSKNQDGWWDLCAGPHVGTTGDLPKEAIELESIAGAYVRRRCRRPTRRLRRPTAASAAPPTAAAAPPAAAAAPPAAPCRARPRARVHAVGAFCSSSATRSGRCCSASTARRGRMRSSSQSTGG